MKDDITQDLGKIIADLQTSGVAPLDAGEISNLITKVLNGIRIEVDGTLTTKWDPKTFLPARLLMTLLLVSVPLPDDTKGGAP